MRENCYPRRRLILDQYCLFPCEETLIIRSLVIFKTIPDIHFFNFGDGNISQTKLTFVFSSLFSNLSMNILCTVSHDFQSLHGSNSICLWQIELLPCKEYFSSVIILLYLDLVSAIFVIIFSIFTAESDSGQ